MGHENGGGLDAMGTWARGGALEEGVTEQGAIVVRRLHRKYPGPEGKVHKQSAEGGAENESEEAGRSEESK